MDFVKKKQLNKGKTTILNIYISRKKTLFFGSPCGFELQILDPNSSTRSI